MATREITKPARKGVESATMLALFVSIASLVIIAAVVTSLSSRPSATQVSQGAQGVTLGSQDDYALRHVDTQRLVVAERQAEATRYLATLNKMAAASTAQDSRVVTSQQLTAQDDYALRH